MGEARTLPWQTSYLEHFAKAALSKELLDAQQRGVEGLSSRSSGCADARAKPVASARTQACDRHQVRLCWAYSVVCLHHGSRGRRERQALSLVPRAAAIGALRCTSECGAEEEAARRGKGLVKALKRNGEIAKIRYWKCRGRILVEVLPKGKYAWFLHWCTAATTRRKAGFHVAENHA